VGKPKDKNPAACYVVMEATGNDLHVEFRRVPYDIERAALAIEGSEMPNEFAQMLRSGTG
jgi:diadenosine tetraphosphatase ApaH/serine/threonine PP2A family protein phosphatase